MVQNVVEKQFLRWEGPTALKFEYHMLGPNWDPRTETWPGRTPRAGTLPARNLAQSDPECRKGGPGLS